MILGEVWEPSGAPHVFTDTSGRPVTFTVHQYGVVMEDAGGASQLAHVEETADPNVIKIAGIPFRRVPDR